MTDRERAAPSARRRAPAAVRRGARRGGARPATGARWRRRSRWSRARAPTISEAAQRLLELLLPAHRAAPRASASAACPGSARAPSSRRSGCYLIARGKRVAVLAVDPSSARSGGSILGDKTRMARLVGGAGGLHPAEPVGRLARRRRAPHARGDARVRGGRLRRRPRRDRRRRAVRVRGRVDGRLLPRAHARRRRRRAAGHQEGHPRARRRPGRSTRPTATTSARATQRRGAVPRARCTSSATRARTGIRRS